jgi:hypothetical protein
MEKAVLGYVAVSNMMVTGLYKIKSSWFMIFMTCIHAAVTPLCFCALDDSVTGGLAGSSLEGTLSRWAGTTKVWRKSLILYGCWPV